MLTLTSRIENAADRPGTVTFVAGDTGVTVPWAQIHDEARAMAAALQARGVVPGDHVAVLGPTTRPLVTLIQATWLAGATIVLLPLPMRLASIEEFVAQTRSRIRRADVKVLAIDAELAPFFSDLPARLASSHLVISRSGAGTVAELGAVGRPSILVPLPGALDQDQFANAGVLADAGGAIRIVQADFSPDRLAAEISGLAAEPARLAAMAGSARTVGRLDAAERLADLVVKVAGI